jgi:hypothetical protein
MKVIAFGASVVAGLTILFSVTLVVPDVSGYVILYSIGDTAVQQDRPNYNPSYGQTMSVRNRYGAGGSDGWEWDSLVRFDLSSIPIGASVTSATLFIYYCDWDDTNPQGRPLTTHRITGDWEEQTVTWNTRPTWLSEATSSSPVPSSINQWMDWDVQSDVQAFVNEEEENYGWTVMDATYWGSANIPITHLRTKEFVGSAVPYLEVTYVSPGVTISIAPSGPTTVPVGGTLEFSAIIQNNTPDNVEGDYWLSASLPNSIEVLIPEALLNYPNPLHGFILPFGSLELSDELWVHPRADTGSYQLIGRIGNYPNGIADEDSFEFQVVE